MEKRQRTKKRKKPKKFLHFMKSKLVIFFAILLVCFCALVGRLMYIEYSKGDDYTKQVLKRQNYDSKTIAYQRGDIIDRNGTVLATSVAVYNVILDCTILTSDEDYLEPTISALIECFPDLNEEDLRAYANEETKRAYIVLAKRLTYDQISAFVEKTEAVDEEGEKLNPNIKGVWFEKEYKREYPYSTLASNVIGFTSAGDVGTTGLENYYDDLLNGINGREYGYLNSESDYEKTLIPAQDGHNIIISIDENIQSICEEKLAEFNEAYKDNAREGDGAENMAVIIQDPNSGEILAMASYPGFDLNNPRDLSAIYTEEQLAELSDEDTMNALNALWQNYCVTATYEPGSVQKPFTVAAGLETGTVTDDMTFLCDGYEMFGTSKVSCVKKDGHGLLTVSGALEVSCNDSLMQMSYLIGMKNFLTYQSIFGFGQKTGIDLPGEANTSSLVYTEENMKPVDLATNSFGQNYNCTMIQMISAFSSLINGGNYYEPHLLIEETDADGNTVSTNDAKLVKKTVSESTSDQLKAYLKSVVDNGSGGTAKVDGYSMGGKTGTAEKLPRGEGNYLVSFMGFAPYDDPQLVIYCIVDTPNTDDQPHSAYAQNIVREILKEVLPYMNIYPDEELTGKNVDLNIKGQTAEEAAQEAGQTETDQIEETAADENQTQETTTDENQTDVDTGQDNQDADTGQDDQAADTGGENQ